MATKANQLARERHQRAVERRLRRRLNRMERLLRQAHKSLEFHHQRIKPTPRRRREALREAVILGALRAEIEVGQ